MAQLSTSPAFWILAAVFWCGAALNRGLAMRRYRRRWWVWFLVSVFCTVIPAVILSYREEARLVRGAHDQRARARTDGPCPHCGARLTRRDIRRIEGRQTCPRCKAALTGGNP